MNSRHCWSICGPSGSVASGSEPATARPEAITAVTISQLSDSLTGRHRTRADGPDIEWTLSCGYGCCGPCRRSTTQTCGSARDAGSSVMACMTPATDTNELGRTQGWAEAGLSFGLIHPRSGPFIGERGVPIRPCRVQSRPVVDGPAQFSKACEGTPCAATRTQGAPRSNGMSPPRTPPLPATTRPLPDRGTVTQVPRRSGHPPAHTGQARCQAQAQPRSVNQRPCLSS